MAPHISMGGVLKGLCSCVEPSTCTHAKGEHVACEPWWPNPSSKASPLCHALPALGHPRPRQCRDGSHPHGLGAPLQA